MATVESWFVEKELLLGWGASARLREVEKYIEQAVKDENHERVDQLNLLADALTGTIIYCGASNGFRKSA